MLAGPTGQERKLSLILGAAGNLQLEEEAGPGRQALVPPDDVRGVLTRASSRGDVSTRKCLAMSLTSFTPALETWSG